MEEITFMNIKIGEYVRTKNGLILKVLEYDKEIGMYLCSNNEGKGYLDISGIVKHSKNIIDLIELGDVLEVYFPLKEKTIKVFVDEYFKDSMILGGIIQKRIVLKAILTKEQYEENCYKLEVQNEQ